MPCWYFEKKELRNTPSFQDGIDAGTEARYRREGARFIIDAGTKMGLRYDTCGTGVVYFHRFYMFHSFKEFHRYITAACCLFLAGKVEETPKKGKDIIKICQSMLSPQVFSVFGDDPREEVMTMERILLQTIKFDLQVEHPYGYLLKFAKFIKGDKEKIQKLVQMAWTFINDSLCTTQCLQWEPEVISVSLMYLGTRLTKFDIQDWHGKVPGTKTRWWEFLVEDITVELMEDICHKVLDLYSNNPQGTGTDSPPVTPSKKSTARDTPPPPPPQVGKRSLPTTPAEAALEAKVPKLQPERQKSKDSGSRRNSSKKNGSVPEAPSSIALPRSAPASNYSSAPPVQSKPDYTQYGAYMASSSSQYPSSFLSQEGSKSIETLVSGSGLVSTSSYLQTQPPTTAASAPAAVPQYPPPAQYPPAPYQPNTYAPPTAYQQPPPVQPQYPGPGGYPAGPANPGAPPPQQAFHTNQPPPQVGQYPPGFPPPQQFNGPPFQGQTNFPPPPPRPGFPPQQPGVSAPPPFQTMPPNTGALNTMMGQSQRPPVPVQNNMVPLQPSSGLPVVRITGRR
ncbi:cyclin-K-like [Mizuhopecten yessoensis]|uniref:cyclin-K-like n=1 Tax=Mizuhopecten yessoensis TaxID=6573 RepID=UPI000B45E525|nr:cyclin-K-like [Mizuhopecten yessoensis]